MTLANRIDYTRWRKGDRVRVNGNSVSWIRKDNFDPSYTNFRKYFRMISIYAGSDLLSKELKSREPRNAEDGYVFIEGGFPGHAILIVDKAIHQRSGETIILLAQSYMPAQNIHIIVNDDNINQHGSALSPWYKVPLQGGFPTIEWEFTMTHLKHF